MQKYKTVEEFMGSLSGEKRAQVDALRHLILDVEPTLQEHIKWNAPSYVHQGEHRITFNVVNKQGVVGLVLHMGALRKEDKKAPPILQDTTGLIAWSSDIRGVLTFTSLADINTKTTQLRQIIAQWLATKVDTY